MDTTKLSFCRDALATCDADGGDLNISSSPNANISIASRGRHDIHSEACSANVQNCCSNIYIYICVCVCVCVCVCSICSLSMVI
jgi:hypothetical protein